MPTIIYVRGWRLFFYSNEGTEPVHIHARKGDAQCKLWLNAEIYDVKKAWAVGMTPRLWREVRKIVFDHFTLIVEEWNRYFGGNDNADD